MPSTVLTGAKHGFRFRNKFNFHVGPWVYDVLCGGMVYGALDHFNLGLQVPGSERSPAEHNPLQTYLYTRQATAHFYTWNKFARAWSGQASAEDQARAQADLLAALSANIPMPICVYREGWWTRSGHHVLAVGCNSSCTLIDVYDPNHPKENSMLMRLDNGQWIILKESTPWDGWFLDRGYYTEKFPVFPPLSLALLFGRATCCTRSRSTNPARVRRPGGAPDSPDYEYFLPWSAGTKKGQPGWRACERCFSLFFTGATGSKICPAGVGGHSPKGGSSALEFSVCTYDGFGETDWFRCTNCASQFWAGPGADRAGKCPAFNSPHFRSAESPNYILDHRVLN